jgi:hypothetical protein
MATMTALSSALSALAEQVAPALEGQALPSPATLYRALIRARDEAVCLEARASARDDSVHRLVGQITTICTETAAHAAKARAAAQITGNATPFRSRFSQRIVK